MGKQASATAPEAAGPGDPGGATADGAAAEASGATLVPGPNEALVSPATNVTRVQVS